MAQPPPLIAHLERHLGPIATGTRYKVGAELLQVAWFADRPVPECTTYATLGMSATALSQSGGEPIRQELLFSHRGPHRKEAMALVAAAAEPILRTRRSLDRGQVLGPFGPILSGCRIEALYCSAPVYFDESLHVFHGLTPPVVFVWLVPISAREATLVADKGWENFEELLARQDPDLLDLDRPDLTF